LCAISWFSSLNTCVKFVMNDVPEFRLNPNCLDLHVDPVHAISVQVTCTGRKIRDNLAKLRKERETEQLKFCMLDST
jgi:hypothetical protein